MNVIRSTNEWPLSTLIRRGCSIAQYIVEEIDGKLLLYFTGSLSTFLSPLAIGEILREVTSRFSLKACQFFDNRYIWGQKHLFSAIWHAINAEKNKRMISNNLSMEILLYTAGQRQIKKALKQLGVKEDTQEIVGVILSEKDSDLVNAFDFIVEETGITLNLDLLDNFSPKKRYITDLLIKEGFSAMKYSIIEIEKAILQRVALLALDA
jgi:tRNA threonylcarbamoyladenosine modification (KEOPS) complex Cgi121 subunit